MNEKERIIKYIKDNRVSTTEVADCLGKSGALDGVLPLNSRHFCVGEVKYVCGYAESNWPIHEELDKHPCTDKIVFVDSIDVNDRALFGDIVSKYILLYQANIGIVVNGKLRDAHYLIKENYPIWCKGVTPIGCFNNRVDRMVYDDYLDERKKIFDGSIAVCDDSGVVIIPKDKLCESFYDELEKIERQEDIWYDCIDRRKWSTYKTICLKEYLNDQEEW